MKKRLTRNYERKSRTNYKQRLELLKSGKLRLVVRKALNNISLQIVEYEANGDKILISVHSVMLKKYGWDLHRGNLPSAYLTGLLCGKLAKEKEFGEIIVDLGLSRSLKGSVQYAAIKGAVDAGLKVNCGEEMFPNEERFSGKTISEEVNKKFLDVKEKIIGEK
ncbi:MAG: 50S ribosomal protein L18 [Nanoarchaeota archaeon]|nr:50S ribosomal protein L18 [Nanoarchaeota archaeon]